MSHDPSDSEPTPETSSQSPAPEPEAPQPSAADSAPPPPDAPYPPQVGAGWPQTSPQVAPQHPQTIVILVLGILSIVFCQLTGPFAWYMGSKAMKEIEASPGQYSGDGLVRLGQILGIVGTILLAIVPLLLLTVFGFAFIGIALESVS